MTATFDPTEAFTAFFDLVSDPNLYSALTDKRATFTLTATTGVSDVTFRAANLLSIGLSAQTRFGGVALFAVVEAEFQVIRQDGSKGPRVSVEATEYDGKATLTSWNEGQSDRSLDDAEVIGLSSE